jgi:hypothetical protein
MIASDSFGVPLPRGFIGASFTVNHLIWFVGPTVFPLAPCSACTWVLMSLKQPDFN